MHLTDKFILIVNDHGPTHYKPFAHLNIPPSRDHRLIFSAPEKVALVVFTGGSDVSPTLYGERPHKSTFFDPARDQEEVAIFRRAYESHIPMAGICRGAQFLCVMARGRLVQDITGHQASHNVLATYPSGKQQLINVSSSHHQMQYPFELAEDSYEILARGDKQLSSHYVFNSREVVSRDKAGANLKMEPDVIWYRNLNALAAQYHPEWMEEDSSGFKYFTLLVDHYLKPLIFKEQLDVNRTGKEVTTSAS